MEMRRQFLKNFTRKCSIAVGTALTATLAALPVHALAFITERTALGENDQLDWSSLGQVFNPFAPDPTAFLPNTFSATSESGLALTVDIPISSNPEITPPFVFPSSLPPVGIPTNFADGDFVLFTGFIPTQPGVPFIPAIGNPGPINIMFETPVKAAGTQFAVDDTSEFTAFISAFDEADTILGTFSLDGTSSLALDNSAVFLGVSSDIANISKLSLSSSESERALGINSFSIVTIPATTSEPVLVWSLMFVGTLGAGLRLNRRP